MIATRSQSCRLRRDSASSAKPVPSLLHAGNGQCSSCRACGSSPVVGLSRTTGPVHERQREREPLPLPAESVRTSRRPCLSANARAARRNRAPSRGVIVSCSAVLAARADFLPASRLAAAHRIRIPQLARVCSRSPSRHSTRSPAGAAGAEQPEDFARRHPKLIPRTASTAP
jgi:hypothetical protein